MFGHESKPSRIYSFGAKLHKEDEAIATQVLRTAHTYGNKLVELERARREKVDAVLAQMSPKLKRVEDKIGPAEELVKALVEKANKEKVSLQSKRPSKETTAALKKAKAALKDLRGKRKLLRTELFEKALWQKKQVAIEKEHDTTMKQARSECGVYWGTYSAVEQAHSGDRTGAPPEFKPFRGEGRIVVQVQGGGKLRDAIDGARGKINGQFQISDETCSTSGVNYRLARIRIGSDEKRAPIWLHFRVKLHRDIPEDAMVKWAWLVGKRVGANMKWKFQLVLSRDEWPRTRHGAGVLALMPGWSMREDGIRVATWCGTDGGYGHLVLPNEQVARYKRCIEIGSIRDKNYDAIKTRLKKMLGKAPDWAKEATATMHQWRAPARLAGFILKWREARWKGDSHAFSLAEAWRKQDKHLWNWVANQRQSIAQFRKNLYQDFAAKMSARYETVVLPQINWAVFGREAKVTEKTVEYKPSAVEEARRLACVSALNQAAKHTMASHMVDPAGITSTCGNCTEPVPCKCSIEQDESRVLNLLRRALTEEDITKFFKQRSTTQMLRLMCNPSIKEIT